MVLKQAVPSVCHYCGEQQLCLFFDMVGTKFVRARLRRWMHSLCTNGVRSAASTACRKRMPSSSRAASSFHVQSSPENGSCFDLQHFLFLALAFYVAFACGWMFSGGPQEYLAADTVGNLHRVSVVVKEKLDGAGGAWARIECKQLVPRCSGSVRDHLIVRSQLCCAALFRTRLACT